MALKSDAEAEVEEANEEPIIEEEEALENPVPELVVEEVAVAMDEPISIPPTINTANLDDSNFNNMLEDAILRFQADTPCEPKLLREESQMNILASVERNGEQIDATGFPAVLISEDCEDMKRTIDSPKLGPNEHLFVSADPDGDPDALELGAGIVLTRSGTMESLIFDPNTIFFDKMDEYKEFPRSETPSFSLTDIKPIDENAANQDQETVLSEVAVAAAPIETIAEEKIDRDAVIQTILRNLDQKEKASSKNIQLQNKLSDYFKRKRVCSFFLIL